MLSKTGPPAPKPDRRWAQATEAAPEGPVTFHERAGAWPGIAPRLLEKSALDFSSYFGARIDRRESHNLTFWRICRAQTFFEHVPDSITHCSRIEHGCVQLPRPVRANAEQK